MIVGALLAAPPIVVTGKNACPTPIGRDMSKPWYQRCYRRMLVDMHITDWDEKFLSQYDPEKMADLYERAGLTSVMFYCQSHVGLCYWPTTTGKMHAGLRGRDIVADMVKQLEKRGIGSCAYYSVIYNNWAFLEHPEWRIQPSGEKPPDAFAQTRYGTCCPNNPGYRAFAIAQTEELLRGCDFDGFFFDMTFWPAICLCPHCRTLYREGTGKEIPNVVDWTSPDWCSFQAAREQWMKEFARDLTATVKRIKPQMPVYHNFACACSNWMRGVPLDSAIHHDFLGADFYGDRVEQLMVTKLMVNLTTNRPAEFMTSRCVNLRDHVRLKPVEEMEMQAFAATLFHSAFLFIDAIDLVGTVNPAVYERIHDIYADTARYEAYLGGEPVEDIAIYFSSESKMDFAENGAALSEVHTWNNKYPHAVAVRGVCRILQQAHMPFGVITRKQLPELRQYKVVVLPNVLRMNEHEAKAFRDYVRRGGKLYASRYTSLTETKGVRHPDFMLSDVFGCHFAADDLGEVAYLKLRNRSVSSWIAPQDYVSLFPEIPANLSQREELHANVLRLATKAEGKVLATLTVPYGSPARGTVFDWNWASIHSSPPWEDTRCPVIVSNDVGKGRVIYSATDIESLDSEVNARLFLGLLRSLIDGPLSYSAEAHPAVWMSVFHQPDKNRLVVSFLNYQAQLPAIPISRIPFTLRPPEGMKFARLTQVPEGTPVEFVTDARGTLRAEAKDLTVFQMLVAETAPRTRRFP